MTPNDNDPRGEDDANSPVVPPTPPNAYPSNPPAYGPPPAGGYPYGSTDPATYGSPPAGGYPYGSDPRYQPGVPSQPFVDKRPGIGWGLLAGALIIIATVVVVGISMGRVGAEAWFVGVLYSFGIVMVAAIATVIPFTTRKIAQGLFIVLGAIPLIWFGVCIQALAGY